MYAAERQQQILRLATEEGRVEVPALAADFGVTPETVRRDLKALARAGLLRRVHGGAIPANALDFEPDLSEREATAVGQKERIARAAVEELPEHGSVILDAGSTTAAVAAVLPLAARLTVLTHALPVAARLADHPSAELHLVGGRVRTRTRAAVDDWALRTYREVTADVVLLAANGFGIDAGLTTPDLAEAAVKRAMIAAARRVVLIADSSKAGQRHFARFGDLTQVDLLITDDALGDEQAAAIEAAGTEVRRT